MKHRHIHAKRGEWVHVHRDEDFSWAGVVVFVVIAIVLLKGCG